MIDYVQMFYETKLNNHGLRYNPFKACVVPRPIAWISTISSDGIVNIGPYSYFNAVSDTPPVIMFSSSQKPEGGDKDSLRNIESSGEFVVNICSYDQRIKMKESSANIPYGDSEAEQFDIETVESNILKAPRIKAAYIALECKHLRTEQLMIDNIAISSKVVFGHVVGIYINDSIIEDGKVSISKLKPIARLGYDEYTVIENIFKMPRG